MSEPTPDTFTPTLTQRARLLVTGHPVHAVSASVPVLSFYGGATVTRTIDATGAEFTVCCAKNLQINSFGLYVLKNGVAQQIAPLVSGRGSIWIDLTDGTANWVGWDGNAPPSGGPIPGFAPLALGGGSGAARPPVPIPPGSPLDSIWTPAYTAAEVDTAAEIAVKLTKNNDQWEQLIALLRQAGVLA